MRGMILLTLLFAFTTPSLPASANFQATENMARPKGYVGDYATVINEEAESQLETKLKQLRERASIEFVVVTLETTGEEDIFSYSLNAARRWKLASGTGDKGGILLMLAMKDRKWRVQITDSLKEDLPEALLATQGERMYLPISQGNTGAAVTLFVDGVVAHLAERRGFKNTPN